MPRHPSESPRSHRVAVFARRPELGRVKTRLCPPLSADQALRLHRAFVEDTLARLSRLEEVSLQLLLSEPLLDPEDLEIPKSWDVGYQAGGDLGGRLETFFRANCEEGRRKVIVVGSDSPTLPLSHLRLALQALTKAEVVLGPATDGGYYLLGCARFIPELFRDILWGTDEVLEQTLEILRDRAIPYRLLPEWYDVDRAEDLERLRADVLRLSKTSPEEIPVRVEAALSLV